MCFKNDKKTDYDHIKTKEEYLKLFQDAKKQSNKKTKKSKNKKLKKALKHALDIRKFEIELYWKRTAFFWAFIVSTYTAIFTLLSKYLDSWCCEKTILKIIIICLSGLGVFFSVAWHMVNKGSKFWQENWEAHVSLLEYDFMGPLYDTFLHPREYGSFWHPFKAYDFSVSKVNLMASFIMILLSSIFFIGVVMVFFEIDFFRFLKSINITFLIPIIILVSIILFMVCCCKGHADIEKSTDENELNMIKIKKYK
ncbi:MAG: hypothetical protein P1P64_03760 [Treponemataceae bacterium]